MSEEFYTIGSYCISKAFFDILMPFISGLLGTIIGGLIAYFSIRASDNRKWKQEKHDKLMAEKREAIAIALDWFRPFHLGIEKVAFLLGSYLQQRLNEAEVRKQWPDFFGTLEELQPPPRLELWLPQDIYKRIFEIITELENSTSLNLFPYPQTDDDWHKRFVQSSENVTSVDKKLDALETELKEEYRKTFD